jgi:hypothetical protein
MVRSPSERESEELKKDGLNNSRKRE